MGRFSIPITATDDEPPFVVEPHPHQPASPDRPLLSDAHLYRGEAPHEVRSATSAAAAVSIEAIRSARQLDLLALVAAAGEAGLTDDEIEQATGWLHQSASARRRELELKGALRRTDRTRSTRTGNSAGVYVATHAGLGALRHAGRLSD